MTNHILQLLAKFHQNLMKSCQNMPKKPKSFFDTNPLLIYPRIKIFFQKTKTSFSSHNQVTTLCQKSEQSYEPFLRSLPNGRTDERTNGQKLNHKSQPLRRGPKMPPGVELEFSRNTALCHMMKNHIPQLLAKFHQILM